MLFNKKYAILSAGTVVLCATLIFCSFDKERGNPEIAKIKQGFVDPPLSARPGVYWYFMDGNMSQEGMIKDLESMKKVGIGNVLFLEVNVGVPRGKVDFFSEQWQELFKIAVREAEKLGINISLGIGPGWTGSGGPWVPASQSMQDLVSSSTKVSGGQVLDIKLPVPMPKKPFFGDGVFTSELRKQWLDFYDDVAVLAFPTPDGKDTISDIDEKALYYRAPYTSQPGVKQFLPTSANYPKASEGSVIKKSQVIDITKYLQPDGMLKWQAPSGQWTIMRFGRRNNGAVTRPAPVPGLGFEVDEFDTVALNAHLAAFTDKILKRLGPLHTEKEGGLKFLHMDSWEMGSQNWTPHFRQEFMKRRGYDPLPFYPVLSNKIVGSIELSERFLWDWRQTAQELVFEYHSGHVRAYAHKHGLQLSIEPYDMNPTSDLELGSIADVPMGEFWSKGFDFNSSFSCVEAASVGHVDGARIIGSEAFTANEDEGWKQYPGSMKSQGDWAFATGINKFYFHTFQHQSLADSLKPGMTMGPYGVEWNRNQTFWPMVGAYHKYITRCQYVLRQGRPVADILYLTPEGAPNAFRPPPSAYAGDDYRLPDKKGYNFDGCAPGQLYKAVVKNHEIVFPGGATYRILVLPSTETMTPALEAKVQSLISAGAIVMGTPPQKSPSLSNYPACDTHIQSISKSIWGGFDAPGEITERAYGLGRVIWGGDATVDSKKEQYPNYDVTAGWLKKMGVPQDFESDGPIRYIHHTAASWDIYFVSSRTDKQVKTDCIFRTNKGSPELWDPLTGETRKLPEYKMMNGRVKIPMQFDAYQSYFVVFGNNTPVNPSVHENFPKNETVATLNAPWQVSFDPKWGGPAQVSFDKLTDWTKNENDGIKYYSGIATYRQDFDLPQANTAGKIYLDLGEVKNLARVRLNGKDLGVVWTAPWRVDITGVVKSSGNKLEIEVANLWPNRLIGDERLPDDGIKDGQWPDWIKNGTPRTSGRYTFATFKHYSKDSPLFKSGLLGPVTIQEEKYK
jgi:hypothetical protein